AKQADGLPSVSWREIAQLLATSVQEAKTLKDLRAESYGLGYLGSIYRLTHQEAAAQQLTEQALLLAQAANAREISYRWQWQLGQIHQVQGERQKAIATYTAAVQNLRSLRSDLAALNSDTQFSFRDEVEPVYRQLVDLLLQSDGNVPPPQINLIQARNVLETLQVVELENFFRAACLDAKPISIDQVDTHTAVLYPILLGDQVKTIVSLPQQPLRLYEAPLDPHWETQIERLRQALTQRNSQEVLPLAQRFYNQLIRPAAADLKTSGVKTLAFVLDGPLRNLPMAVLQDGHQYLMEQYSLALTPGLQLLKAQPLAPERLKALFAGLTEARQGFPALDHVAQEFADIQTSLPNQSLLNQRFTRSNLLTATTSTHFPILHFATHGQFSSQADETFILSWDERLDIDQLNALIRRTPSKTREIDLLVLSACETATGDRRAALGLAGVAVRAGARSTLATLWLVNDASSAVLINTFYQELAKTRATKAEALRQAQIALLSNPKYRHPYYWAPYVL
ncbi:MAG: CHAT domain-containing protein, partial [Thermosynechococcaceae cyanobacterium]